MACVSLPTAGPTSAFSIGRKVCSLGPHTHEPPLGPHTYEPPSQASVGPAPLAGPHSPSHLAPVRERAAPTSQENRLPTYPSVTRAGQKNKYKETHSQTTGDNDPLYNFTLIIPPLFFSCLVSPSLPSSLSLSLYSCSYPICQKCLICPCALV